jgi:ABC-type branched-subunit amino acid transport system substrate-binding protein
MSALAMGGKALMILLLLAGPLAGRTGGEVILGQSCALTGPTAFLGTEMHRGAKAYFDTYAESVVLKVKDDGYEPSRCIQNTAAFLAGPVDALFGYVGTPTAKAAVPLAREKNTIFFGAFTGAGFLSDYRINPHAFSIRASYDAEIENMVRRLKTDLNVGRIGLFVQRDAFGLAGVTGALKAVEAVGGVEIVPPVPPVPAEDAPESEWDRFWSSVPNYRRNTVQVGRSARLVSGSRVEAVIMVGAYRPCAMAINLWKRLEFDAVFVNISFVGSKALADYLGGDTRNVLISQVVPDPWNARLPLVRDYQKAMGGSRYGFVSLEGYIAAKALHTAIVNIGGALDFAALKASLEAMSDTDLGGVSLSFGPGDHRGRDAVYLTAIEAVAGADGKYDYKFRYIDTIVKE